MDLPSLARVVGDDITLFGELLTHLTNPETAQRKQAEAMFGSLKEHFPEGLVLKLMTFVKEAPTPVVRSFAATLLHRVLVRNQPSLWTAVSTPKQDQLKNDLLKTLMTETDVDVRLKVADVTSELYSKVLGCECWPELLFFVNQTIEGQHDSETARNVETCVHILADVAPVLRDSMDHAVENFVRMIRACLTSHDSGVRLEAIKATKCFAIALEEHEDLVKLKVVMQDLLAAFSAIPVTSQGAAQAHAVLIELAEYVPFLFEDVVQPLLMEFIKRLRDPSGDIGAQTMALEFILTLTDGLSETELPALQEQIADLFQIVTEYLLTIEDVPDWYARAGVEDGTPSFGEVRDLAIEAIDRLATSLPSHIFLSLFSPCAQQWARDPDWKKRHAVLDVIGQMAEGCAAELTESVVALLEICTQGMTDPHVRVRWAACQATGLLADEVGGTIQKHHRNQIIHHLMQAPVIDDPGAMSVQQHALHCLVNLLQNSEHDLKGPVLDAALKWVLQSMQFAHEGVSQAALGVMSSVVELVEAPGLAPYYNDCMKAVFSALQRIADPTDLAKIAQTVEVMTRIGSAAGKACFVKEYQVVMEYLRGLKDQAGHSEDRDTQFTVLMAVLRSTARVSSIMTSDFDALDTFRDLLLEALATEPKLESISAAEMDDSEDEDPFKIVIAGKGFRIDTYTLEFYRCGVQSAMTMARSLKAGFFSVLVPALEALLPAMEYKLMKDIRIAAIQAQPPLLDCAMDRHRRDPTDAEVQNFGLTVLRQQWEAYMGKLKDLEQETNEISSPAVLESVSKTLDIVQGNLDPSMMETLFSKLEYVLQYFSKLRAERAAVQEGELTTEEQEEFETEVSTEHGAILGIQKILSVIMQYTTDQYFAHIRHLLTSLHQLLETLQRCESDYEIMELIFTIMTDVCDYSPMGREIYAADICQLFEKNLDHDYDAVRQIAAFGVSIVAAKAPSIFRPMAVGILQRLAHIVRNCSDSVATAATGSALDNAVSSLGKILSSHGDVLGEPDQMQLLHLWLNRLPLRHDIEEAIITHSWLLQAATQHDAKVLGPNKENLVRVVEVLMELLAHEGALASAEDLQKIPQLLKSLEHEAGCSQLAEQKMQKWSEEQKAQFSQNMKAVQSS